MKQLIFNKGKGWYIVGSNYKNKTDVAYMTVYFNRKIQEPQGKVNEKGVRSAWIEIKEQMYSSYKGKIQLTIFDYIETCSPKEAADQKQEQPIYPDEIDSDALPFY